MRIPVYERARAACVVLLSLLAVGYLLVILLVSGG
jgi:hypothetical protein